MSATAIQFPVRLSALMLLGTLSACDWVDSTGVQGVETGTALRNAEPVALVENMALTAPLAGEGAELTDWQWQPRNLDERDRCAGIDGFDATLATSTLAQACANGVDCTIALDESSNAAEATRFTLQLPPLRSPVALSYQLSTRREDGSIVERQQLLCGVAINEAPSAIADDFLAVVGQTLTVPSDSPRSLLANDGDDDDVRNQPLQVQSIEEQPRHAVQFSVDAHGGLIYQPREDAPAGDDGSLEDSFTYVLTDGLHQVSARATIRIVAANEPPERTQRLPVLVFDTIAESEPGAVTPQTHDLSAYFSDPDGDTLTLSISSDQLPVSGVVRLNADGLLQASPTARDAGLYRTELVVSDGIASISETVILLIVPGTENRAPTADDIDNRTVRNRFRYDVSRFFNDADGDTLTFDASGLPSGVTISEEGVISGQADARNRGRWLIRVSADDGRGGSITDAFQLEIR